MDMIDELEYLREERKRLNKACNQFAHVILWGGIISTFLWIWHIAGLKEEHTRQLNQARRETREAPTMRERDILSDNQYLYQGEEDVK